MIAWFIRARPRGRRVLLVHSGAPWVLSSSFGFEWFIRARLGGRWFHFGAPQWSSFSLALAPGVVWFNDFCLVRVGLVNSGTPRLSSVSFVFVSFIRACLSGGRAHSCSFGSFGRAPEVVVFINVRLVHYSGAPQRS